MGAQLFEFDLVLLERGAFPFARPFDVAKVLASLPEQVLAFVTFGQKACFAFAVQLGIGLPFGLDPFQQILEGRRSAVLGERGWCGHTQQPDDNPV